MSEYVVLRQTDVDALLEEWGELDQDPFWRPVENVEVTPLPTPYMPPSDAGDPRYRARLSEGTA